MVNDYIEQKFDILHKVADVSITLRDILVMNEQISQGKMKYNLFPKQTWIVHITFP